MCLHEFPQEQYLNSFNNYILEANGIEMHFIHERSPHANAIPLLLLHGWPGSYFEFHKIAKRLANPGTPTLVYIISLSYTLLLYPFPATSFAMLFINSQLQVLLIQVEAEHIILSTYTTSMCIGCTTTCRIMLDVHKSIPD